MTENNDEEFTIIDTKDGNVNIKELKEIGKEKLSDEKHIRSLDDLRLKDTMNAASKDQSEALQNWISNNLRYLKLTVTYLGVFANDDLSRAMIKSLFERLTSLQKDFVKTRNPKNMNYSGLPFDQTQIVHMRQVLLPLVGQILPLKKEIEGFSKKFFKI